MGTGTNHWRPPCVLLLLIRISNKSRWCSLKMYAKTWTPKAVITCFFFSSPILLHSAFTNFSSFSLSPQLSIIATSLIQSYIFQGFWTYYNHGFLPLVTACHFKYRPRCNINYSAAVFLKWKILMITIIKRINICYSVQRCFLSYIVEDGWNSREIKNK